MQREEKSTYNQQLEKIELKLKLARKEAEESSKMAQEYRWGKFYILIFVIWIGFVADEDLSF